MIAVFARYPDLSPEQYDEVVSSLDLDANPPAGAVLHMAGDREGEFVVSEIWRTEEAFRAFFDYRLRPALLTHGVVREPTIEVKELHNLWAVEMETVERSGAVSLPATYAGAVL